MSAGVFTPSIGAPGGGAKTIVRGNFTRREMPPAGAPIDVPTIRIPWADVEKTPGNRVASVIGTKIDTAVSRGYPGIRLRLSMGAEAPDWAKALANGPINYIAPQGGQAATIPDIWSLAFQNAAAAFWTWLAANFDDDDRLFAVFAATATTFYTEPCIRGASNQQNRTNLLAAGYTITKDKALQNLSLDQMTVFTRTPIGNAYNPLDEIDSTTSFHRSVADMVTIMDHHTATFGARSILQNNSIREWYIDAPPPMYAPLVSRSGTYETQYQVAGSTEVAQLGPAPTHPQHTVKDAFINTMEWAIDYLNATGIEMVDGYLNLGISNATYADWSARLQANGP